MANTDKQLNITPHQTRDNAGSNRSAMVAKHARQEGSTMGKHDIDFFDELASGELWAESEAESSQRKIKVNGLNRREIEKRAEEKRLKRLLDDLDFNYEDM
jgi:hypothetical protein